jgi:hypothetical protein
LRGIGGAPSLFLSLGTVIRTCAFFPHDRCDSDNGGQGSNPCIAGGSYGQRVSRTQRRWCLRRSVPLVGAPADHATIARFRVRHEQALAGTFTQVLALCARAGLVSVGVVALDGSLVGGNASPAATRS